MRPRRDAAIPDPGPLLKTRRRGRQELAATDVAQRIGVGSGAREDAPAHAGALKSRTLRLGQHGIVRPGLSLSCPAITVRKNRGPTDTRRAGGFKIDVLALPPAHPTEQVIHDRPVQNQVRYIGEGQSARNPLALASSKRCGALGS